MGSKFPNNRKNHEKYAELVNAEEILENYANESEVTFEVRSILQRLEMHFGTE